MKFGIDVHGVADFKKKFFANFSRRAVDNGHSVHIITGSMKTDEVKEKLRTIGIVWTHFFSVSDYLIGLGVEHHFSDPNNPWFPPEEWESAKGKYCEMEGIDLHFDDSKVYCKFFSTLYVRVV